MSLKKILIFGAGDGGKEILKIIIEDINKINPTWEVIGFIDIDPKKKDNKIFGYTVFYKDFGGNPNGIYGISGVKNNRIRQNIIKKEIGEKGFKLASLIHPSVIKPNDFANDSGVAIFPSVKISYNVKIGEGVLINYDTLLGHDLRIGDYTFVGPSVTIPGGCSIGNSCIIGAGSTFVEGVSIGDNAIIGAGTMVFSEVRASTSVTDMPRKIASQLKT